MKWLTSLRFTLCEMFNTELFTTPNERAFRREFQEMVERINKEQQ